MPPTTLWKKYNPRAEKKIDFDLQPIHTHFGRVHMKYVLTTTRYWVNFGVWYSHCDLMRLVHEVCYFEQVTRGISQAITRWG